MLKKKKEKQNSTRLNPKSHVAFNLFVYFNNKNSNGQWVLIGKYMSNSGTVYKRMMCVKIEKWIVKINNIILIKFRICIKKKQIKFPFFVFRFLNKIPLLAYLTPHVSVRSGL